MSEHEDHSVCLDCNQCLDCEVEECAQGCAEQCENCCNCEEEP